MVAEASKLAQSNGHTWTTTTLEEVAQESFFHGDCASLLIFIKTGSSPSIKHLCFHTQCKVDAGTHWKQNCTQMEIHQWHASHHACTLCLCIRTNSLVFSFLKECQMDALQQKNFLSKRNVVHVSENTWMDELAMTMQVQKIPLPCIETALNGIIFLLFWTGSLSHHGLHCAAHSRPQCGSHSHSQWLCGFFQSVNVSINQKSCQRSVESMDAC